MRGGPATPVRNHASGFDEGGAPYPTRKEPHDRADSAKHAVAKEPPASVATDSRLVPSVQPLNELFAVLTRQNRPRRLSERPSTYRPTRNRRHQLVQDLTPEIAFRATETRARHGFSFWDALVGAANEAGAATLYTKDLQDGRDVEGGRIVNPFLVP
jgi:predicted nucleic acid-binding protein